MASALSLNSSIVLQSYLLSSHTKQARNPRPSNLLLPRHSLATSTLAFSRRPNRSSALSSSKKKKKSLPPYHDTEEGDDVDVDAFETLFSMLEEDLKNDDATIVGEQDDDDVSEEDLEKLQRELQVASRFDFDDDDDDDQDVEVLNSTHDSFSNDNGIGEEDNDEEEEERPVKLRHWQLRGLANALKIGKRKTRIKSLAAELRLDRAIVLDLLRDPPPNLVMMSAALPDEPEPVPLIPERKLILPAETRTDAENSRDEVKAPVHVMQRKWHAQKRLKKFQIETLEKVYNRTRRPTNTMVSSIVQVTNLPRKRVVQWFEDKRTEKSAPEHNLPYRRSVPETVSSQ